MTYHDATAAASPAASPLPVTYPVADHRRPGADCARLGPCETAWPILNGAEQARCPVRCREFTRRAAAEVDA